MGTRTDEPTREESAEMSMVYSFKAPATYALTGLFGMAVVGLKGMRYEEKLAEGVSLVKGDQVELHGVDADGEPAIAVLVNGERVAVARLRPMG